MPLLLYLCAVVLVTVFLIPGPGRQMIGGLTGAEAATCALVLIAVFLVAAVRLALRPSIGPVDRWYGGSGDSKQ